MDEKFFTPPDHVGFKAKKLFCVESKGIDGSIAYIDKNGGGPTKQHTHEHNHLFVVTQGQAKVLLGDKVVVIKKDESFLVDGKKPHSVWNDFDGQTVMIGITIK